MRLYYVDNKTERETDMSKVTDYTATGLKFNAATREHDTPVYYSAATEIEVLRWINFNRDYLKNPHIIQRPSNA